MTDQLKRDARNSLTDPHKLAAALGWLKGSKRQSGGIIVCCPSHGERNPSCSLTLGPDGTVRARCFACDWSADGLGCIALAHGLRLNRPGDFRTALAIAAEIGGNRALAAEILGDDNHGRDRAPVPVPEPVAEVDYPDAFEVADCWRLAGSVAADGRVTRSLVGRKLDPSQIADLGLARSLTDFAQLPPWASYRGQSWRETGHRMVLRVWDHLGHMRSLRAWRVTDGDSPKRLPPAGKRASGLVLANRMGVMMLRSEVCPMRLWLVEGEPDFVRTSIEFGRDDAVLGIGSGSWTENFAQRVPVGTRVCISTHPDDAGDRYAEKVMGTLSERHMVWRWRMVA